MTEARCIGEPVSWLRIERYVLAELDAESVAAIDAHLARCAACRACVEQARRPHELPALPSPTPGTAHPVVRSIGRSRRRPTRRALALSGLAAAAAILLVVLPRRPIDQRPGTTGTRPRGGEVAMTLVRERDGAIVENPTTFAPGDRFHVLVTCAPGHDERVRVYAVEGGTWSAALPAQPGFRCGNRVALAGAFRLTGSTETRICVAFGEAPEAGGPPGVDGGVPASKGDLRCRTLGPSPDPGP